MKVEIVNVTNYSQIKKLGSAITVVGLSLDEDGAEAFADWCHELAKFKMAKPKCYITKGKTMNALYHLKGDNAYQDDLNIVSFDLNDMEKPLAMTMPGSRLVHAGLMTSLPTTANVPDSNEHALTNF